MRTILYLVGLFTVVALAYVLVLPILLDTWDDLKEDEPWREEWK